MLIFTMETNSSAQRVITFSIRNVSPPALLRIMFPRRKRASDRLDEETFGVRWVRWVADGEHNFHEMFPRRSKMFPRTTRPDFRVRRGNIWTPCPICGLDGTTS